MGSDRLAALAKARAAARAVAMASFTLSMLAGVSVAQRLASAPQVHAVFQDWMKRWADGLLRIFGMQVTLATPPPPAASGARLVVASHRSPIDILLLLKHFGGVVLSRGDLARWPVLGLAARRAETIFVDRQDTFSGVVAIRAIRERLQQGRTVIVFPEGTTNRGDQLRPFLGGAFTAARGLSVEVVPVGIAYQPGAEFFNESFVTHIERVAGREVTRLACAFGTPRPLSGSRKELTASLEREVQELVHTARRALDSSSHIPERES